VAFASVSNTTLKPISQIAGIVNERQAGYNSADPDWTPVIYEDTQVAKRSSGLTSDNKLTTRTVPKIVYDMQCFVTDAKHAGIKFRGRKVGIEAALSSILIDFFKKYSEEEQFEILRRRIPEYERLVDAYEAAENANPSRDSQDGTRGETRQ
jgi:hypothetical protein